MEARTPTGTSITRILEASEGLSRREVLDRLAPVVYDELRVMAGAQLRTERPDHTLQPTALVNEAYLRLMGADHAPFNDRLHFFRAAAQAMRRILIEYARKRQSLKRGDDPIRVSLDQLGQASWDEPENILAVESALVRLEKQDPRAAEVVQLRYFAGLSVPETAQALEISERTVMREWGFARAWLRRVLR